VAEQLIREVSATFEGGGGLGQGKLRLTTERLVFERKKVFGGAGDVTSFPLANIQTASMVGVVDKKLKVRAGATDLIFKSALTSNDNSPLKDMAKLLQRAIAGEPLQPPGTEPPTVDAAVPPAASHSSEAGASWIGELERLAKLHTGGTLTDDEFAQAKRKLLAD
jgi:hypothetical protein